MRQLGQPGFGNIARVRISALLAQLFRSSSPRGKLRGNLTSKAPLERTDFDDHVRGRERIGAIPFIDPTRVGWTCIDLDVLSWGCDVDDLIGINVVQQIVIDLEKTGLRPVVERSKGKGWHIWLFFDVPVPAAEVRAVLRRIALRAGAPDTADLVCPRSDRTDNIGNGTFLPLFGGDSCGRTRFHETDENGDLVEVPDQEAVLRELQWQRSPASAVLTFKTRDGIPWWSRTRTDSIREDHPAAWIIDELRAVGVELGPTLIPNGDKLAFACPLHEANQPRSKGGSAVFFPEGNGICSSAKCGKRWSNPREFLELRDQSLRGTPTGSGQILPVRASMSLPSADERMFHGLVGEVVSAFDPFTEASREAIALQFLVGFGNLVGSTPYFQVGGTRHHTNEFLLIVGRSSLGRKGESKEIAFRLLREADPDWKVRSGLSTAEGLIHHVRDATTRMTKGGKPHVDPGVSDKRLMAVETEFAAPLKRMTFSGNTLSPILRDAWDATGVLATLTKAEPEQATHAHISLIAHSTIDDLAEHLSKLDIANGFGNRFLFAHATRSKILPNPGTPAKHTIRDLGERIKAALEFGRNCEELRRDDEANALYERFYRSPNRDQPGLVGGLVDRSAPHVTRLSTIYALLDSSPVIQGVHMQAALAAWAYSEASVRLIFHGQTGNTDADVLIEEMEIGDKKSRTELNNDIFGKHMSGNRLSRAIDAAVRFGAVEVFSIPSGTKGGRPAIWVRRVPCEALGESAPDAGNASDA